MPFEKKSGTSTSATTTAACIANATPACAARFARFPAPASRIASANTDCLRVPDGGSTANLRSGLAPIGKFRCPRALPFNVDIVVSFSVKNAAATGHWQESRAKSYFCPHHYRRRDSSGKSHLRVEERDEEASYT